MKMSLFKNILSSEESLFLNPQFLDFDYQPKLIPHRENQQYAIAACIKPLLQKRNGRNAFVIGKPGIGKTVSLKHVLDELREEYSEELFCIYVNCWKKDTGFKVITEICEQVGYTYTFNKNFDDLLNSATKIINQKSAVIVLDEADRLHSYDIVYTLLEMLYRKCLILITNETNFLATLDPRIKSRLMPEVVEFKSYSHSQTKDILKQRVQYAFAPNIWERQAFDYVVDQTFKSEDIRVGLFLMKESGETAESESSRKISPDHVLAAISKMELFKKKDVNLFDQEEKSLLDLIRENSGKTIMELFRIYEADGGKKSYRTFQRKLKDLEKSGMLTIREHHLGAGGRTSIIEYKVEKAEKIGQDQGEKIRQDQGEKIRQDQGEKKLDEF